ncbi:MAG: FAD-binding oxidoreductase [Candidatus Nanopelagicales bacterium]|jgi:glycine/D-amino acid oxidase-like deaminating enzyme|nr:FAD-binding oxidoreductase [Candidatus Nanopelagicales bacterium]
MTHEAGGLRDLSFWWDSLGAPPAARAPLDGDLDVDVAIVGAGYTGLWTAYYLTQLEPRLQVAVVEARVAGFGASGRNGGWCSALFPASIDAVARMSSRVEALAMQHAMHATVDEVGRVAAVEGLAIDWAKGGTVGLARTQAQLERARAAIAHWRSWGFGAADYRLLDADEAAARAGATDVLGATFTPHCAAIHPAKLVRGLAEVVERRGVRILEQTVATSVEAGVVRTAWGDVRAPFVVRATEGFTARLPGHRRTLLPVYSLMLATEPLPDDVWAEIGLAARETFNDARHLIIYGQRTADGRLAFGGRGAPYHFASRVEGGFDRVPAVHEGLWRTLVELFPVLAPYRATHTWGGPLGIPRDWFASCGLDRRTGLAWAGGYVGDGVATSNLAGRTLADLIVGRTTELTRLPWVGHRSRRWEPEPLRWLGANGGLAVMSSADAAEARTGRPARRAAVFGRLLGH